MSTPAPLAAGPPWWRRLVMPSCLWLLGVAFGAITIKQWIQLNDEGLMLQAASRISDGQVPYRDFWWFYPPGQPYLLALVWKVTGPSLMGWRVVRVLAGATVALLAWKLAAKRAGRSEALVAWLVAILAVSSATGPHPYPIALCLALGSILALGRRPSLAGALAGMVAVWRIEFAAYLVLASVVGLLIHRAPRSTFLKFSGWAGGVCVLVYLPLAVVAGASDVWDLLVRYPVLEFSQYQSLPFPLVFDGGGNAQGFDLIAQVLSFHAPLALIVTLIASIAALVLCVRPGRWIEAVAAIFGIGMAHYLLVRADAFHVGPLAVMDAVLGAWAISAVLEGRRKRSYSQAPRRRLGNLVALGCACLVSVGLLWTICDDGWKRYREVRDARYSRQIAIDVADGVREMPVTRCSRSGSRVERCRLSDLEQMVNKVRSSSSPGNPIYVATKRSDLITAGAPLFYILAERPNATRYDIAAPGVLTSLPVQREIIEQLQRSHALVVRDGADITAAPEPNRAGRSTGVVELDRWLAANYRVVARFGVWTLLEFVGDTRREGPEAR